MQLRVNDADLIRRPIHCNGGLIATLVERIDRRPIRPVATGRRNRPVGMYPSVKCGRAEPWESRVELHALHHAEVNTEIVGYRTQPHSLEMSDCGEISRYTPDLELVLATDAIEIVEIKSAYDPSADARYAHKLDLACEVYRSQGWAFRVVEANQLLQEPRFKAVQEIQSYRRASLTPADTSILSRLFRATDQVSFQELTSAYPTHLLGKAKACAMMVRRMIKIDLSNGLCASAAVTLVSGSCAHG
ncbi:hypothetical protein OIU13_12130 [Brevundimonas sp. BT-123]|uniref:TnsA endonuclease N-terminal domain-containing protein n=1 Tax=Brevundimonas sp. BT-123 TaxID=2986928 RepID=UPI0022356050|nr:TnsA endonuclease N-terminal domain-containing protein [Brevundimonas sp. BT-123]MCW0047275.1 hypothetical protein [Brevundimonas sp. BT-123]